MQQSKVVVLGSGGHAKVVIDILMYDDKYEIVGFTSRTDEFKEICGIPYLGDDSILPKLFMQGIRQFILAVGSNQIRKRLFDEMLSLGYTPINAVHPTAHISSYSKLGQGVVIMAGAVVNPYVTIGNNVIINTLAGVDHDCIIHDHVHIAPRAALAGNVIVGEGSFIGIGSSVIPEITIGEWSTVGAGSVVVKNIAADVTVLGVPAKILIKDE